MFGKGISRSGDILDHTVENIVEKSGAWFAYNGDKKWGRDAKMRNCILKKILLL